MRQSADVKSLQALEDAKRALVEFRETAQAALTEAQSDVQRTLWWVQNDRKAFWQREIKRRADKVNEARSELYRAKLAAMDDRASCIDQKRLLERAIRAYEESQEKLRAVEKWARMLEREYMLFKGRCQPMARSVEGELPKAEAELTLLADQLHQYVSLSPGGRSRRSAAPPPATEDETPKEST